ncbi:MAG: THUMP domain-containing protein [Candidatus Bathyarchaeia archaeon]|nr:RNA methyltransferase [Candidatus Bathyarchaeota archaeon A05DMB-4]MDH7595526.1 THUMP domain-containing protein [Candidatus Bathyarchaeota archaeon]
MLRNFNLLITTARGTEEDASSEIWYLLGEIGDTASKVDKTGVSGLVAAKTTLDPLVAIEKLRELLKERPYEFRYSYRIIPIEKVVRTDVAEIQKVVTELASKIKENETFRVTLEKRFTTTSSKDLIDAAAMNIERKVDLNKPDKIVLLEVVGGLTGISIIKPNDILAIMREKI